MLPIFGKKVTVAVFDGADPVIFTDINGDASGFYPSLIPKLLPNDEIEYITNLTFNEAKERVISGEIDILPAFIKTKEREKIFDFNEDSVMVSWSALYIDHSSNIESVLDLRNKKIALMNGGQNAKNFIKFMMDLDLNFEAVYLDTFTEMKEAVLNKEVYGMIAFNTLFKSNKRLKPTDIVFAPTKSYIATGKNFNKEILREIDLNLRILKSNSGSSYYQELNRWFMYDTIETYPDWLKSFIYFSILTVVTILFIVLILNIHIKKINLINKKQKKLLAKTEHRCSLLVNNTHDLIISVDSELRFTFFNKRSLSFFNVKQKKVIGSSVKEFVLTKKCTDLFMLIVKALEGNNEEGEINIDSINTLYISAAPIIENSEITGVVCFAKDITAKNELVRESNYKNKIEALGTFTSCIAHDFKNLLNPVIGLTEHLLTTKPSIEENKEGLDLILKTALKANNMIKNLLDFNLMKKVDLKQSCLNLLISDFYNILKQTVYPHATIKLKLCNDSDWVLINKSEIEQVLLNLVINSRDAMATGGTITIKTYVSHDISSYLDRDTYVSGSFFTIEVLDTGEGIAPDLIDNIFKPHFTTKGNRGSGMGLASSFGIIKKHRGYLNVVSELNKGSSFKIFLPLISPINTSALNRNIFLKPITGIN